MEGKTPVKKEGSLRWSTAARIAGRDLRASWLKFFFVVLSVAVGVSALTGVRSFSSAFRRELSLRARSILAADLAARLFHSPTADQQRQLDALTSQGVDETEVTEIVSMASTVADSNPIMVSIKAVDPAKYPFYGTVDLQSGRKLTAALDDNSVAVADDLLIRLNAKVRDMLRIGNAEFRIIDVLRNEPDRLSAAVTLGPRILMSRSGIEKAGLLQPGMRSGQRVLFKVDSETGSGDGVKDGSTLAERPRSPSPISLKDLDAKVSAILPEAQVVNYREANPTLTQGLDRATNLLSLVSLVAMVLGAIGVAMAIRAHLRQRMDSIAVMKSLGARSGQIMRIYLLETVFIGIAGGVLGGFLGIGVERVFPVLLRKFVSIHPQLGLELPAIAVGLATGLLTTVLFTVPPLLEIRKVRPAIVLRREMEESGTARSNFLERWPQLLVALGILVGLGGIAASLTDSALVGRWFAIGLASALILLLGLAMLMLRTIRMALKSVRGRISAWLRQGLANLYRPGNQSAAMLAALGIGVMLSMTVFLVQQAIVKDLRMTTPKNLPNVFLLDVSPREIDGLAKLVAQQPGVQGKVEMIPVISSRIAAIDGKPIAERDLPGHWKRTVQSLSVSYAAALPDGVQVLSGKWWPADTKDIDVSIGEHAAQELKLHVGSTIDFVSEGRTISAKVVATHRYNELRAGSRSDFLFPPAALAGLPVIWYGGVHIAPGNVTGFERAMFSNYPTVTVISLAEALEIVRTVVEEIARVVRSLAAFSIFSGIILLAASVAGTRLARMREIAILKALGATGRRIAAIFSVEFAVLGTVAGFAGVLFATVLSRILLKKMEVDFSVQWVDSLIAIAGTAALAVAAGWIASYDILRQKPLPILRSE